MKVILYMAMSANGIIAGEDNGEEFLSHENWNTFVELAHRTGCMIWGRKTHEVVREWEQEYWDDVKNIRKIIVSHEPMELEEGCILATSPKEALEKAKAEGFGEVILSGGSTLNASFAQAGLIDEVVINVEPVVVGKGIPLFAREEFELSLQLQGIKELKNGIVQLRYAISK